MLLHDNCGLSERESMKKIVRIAAFCCVVLQKANMHQLVKPSSVSLTVHVLVALHIVVR